VECFFQSIWFGVGYAPESFAKLVVGGSSPQCRGLENGFALHHVVFIV
jgi:hypothetical protein